MALSKECYVLTSYYKKKYKDRYKTASITNDYSAAYGFDKMLKGLSPDDVKELLDYWFSVVSPQRHRLDWFFFNYEKLLQAKAEQDEDRARRDRLRQESAERARKWRESGRKGITSN